jgi:hypothetical protein
MTVRRAQASILSGVNSAANGLILDSGYPRTSAGYIPTQTSSVTEYTSSTTWTRPSNVHWIDVYLVGSGGSGACGAGARSGGGGGGGSVIQVNKFYVGDYDTWYIIIGAGGANCPAGNQGSCCCNSFGQPGGPTIFTPTSSSFNFSVYSGVDSSNLRRTLIAPGGGAAGHPCGSAGTWSLGTSGGHGSNENTSVMWGVARNSYSPTRIIYSGYGTRSNFGSNTGGGLGFGGGGGGAGGVGVGYGENSTGISGKALQAPFSGTYGGGGGGGGGSGVDGGGGTGTSGTFGTGGGGGGSQNSGNGGLGGTGRAGIRLWYSS